MTHPFEITYQDVGRLNDYQLTDVLDRLLRLEAESHGIASSAVQVSLKIDVPDGGEDGLIEWEDGPGRTHWLPQRLVLFQCKATPMTPQECGKEILKPRSNDLKPRVEEVLDRGGSYVLFYGRSCSNVGQNNRIKKIRLALGQAGKSYANIADIHIYDANRIASWVNQFIPAVVVVSAYVGRALPIGLQTWDAWSKYADHHWGLCPTTRCRNASSSSESIS